jgi:hypothetical protein
MYIRNEGLKFIPIFEILSQRPDDRESLSKFILHMLAERGAESADLQSLLAQAIASTIVKDAQALIKYDLDRMIERVVGANPDLVFVDYFLLPIAFIIRDIGINVAILNPTLIEFPLTEDTSIDFLSILKIPVVHICPKELDFPHRESTGYQRYYIEASVDLSRKQESLLWNREKERRPLLFCSFGSQSRIYAKAQKVVQAAIDAIAAKPEWQMIISLGDPLRAENFSAVPTNVMLLNMVPQLAALQMASMMITHGGLNSIKECIFFGIPMIVIPFDIDQHSNAARVVYHGLGLMENAETISVEQLLSMLERIENDPSFKNRVDLMKSRFREIEISGVGVNTVQALLKRPMP